ncbi:PvaA [Acrasis kona]|uniref:PvaA n=1 Tax=Acrasis kona TaxID=1008807 RepID=A0AAW2ZS55_9EUKA
MKKSLIITYCLVLYVCYAQVTNWGYNLNNTRYSESGIINSNNIKQLGIKWALITQGDIMTTPTIMNHNNYSMVFVPDSSGNIYAVNQRTGTVIWKEKISSFTGKKQSWSRSSPAYYEGKIYIGDQKSANMICLNATDGRKIWMTELDNHSEAQITMSPTLYNNIVFVGTAASEEGAANRIPGYKCCTFQGRMFALSADNGTILWSVRTLPDNKGDHKGYSGNSLWGSAAPIDPQRDAVYVATGGNFNTPDSYKSCLKNTSIIDKLSCEPANYVNSIMSISISNGSILWSRNLGGPDMWTTKCQSGHDDDLCIKGFDLDHDFAQAPMLFNIKGRDVVGAGQKSGFFHTLDRDSGKIIWSKRTGPGNSGGGCGHGSAMDDERIYIGNSNAGKNWERFKNGFMCKGGFWVAISKETGNIVWQQCDPISDPEYIPDEPIPAIPKQKTLRSYAFATGALSVTSSGVVFAGSFDPRGAAYGFDAKTGVILWKKYLGSSIGSGAAISDDMVVWGIGWRQWGKGTAGNKLFGFKIMVNQSTSTYLKPTTQNHEVTHIAPTKPVVPHIPHHTLLHTPLHPSDKLKATNRPTLPSTTKPVTAHTAIPFNEDEEPEIQEPNSYSEDEDYGDEDINYRSDSNDIVCGVCPSGHRQWSEIGYTAPTNGDRCQCIKSRIICTSCPVGYIPWYNDSNALEPSNGDDCQCVISKVKQCPTCPVGFKIWYDLGWIRPNNGDQCQCVALTKRRSLHKFNKLKRLMKVYL